VANHAAEVTGGPLTYTLNPFNDFDNDESCTVTIFADKVSDQDTNDPPDNMTVNRLFTFTMGAAPPPPPTPGEVVISEVYGGGGNAGATFKNDFIELYNRTDHSITLDGWS